MAFCGNKFEDLGEEGERNPELGSARPGMAGARRSSGVTGGGVMCSVVRERQREIKKRGRGRVVQIGRAHV